MIIAVDYHANVTPSCKILKSKLNKIIKFLAKIKCFKKLLIL